MIAMQTNCNQALRYWTIGIQYLHMVQSVAEKTVQQGNPRIVVSDNEINEGIFMEATKWSDYHLIIPLLFNFYHGLEIILKGFLRAKGCQLRSTHKLSQLLNDFNSHFPNTRNTKLSQIFYRYINQSRLPKILKDFCDTSGITIDDYYQSLKYPESTEGQVYQHWPLKYKGKEGVQFFFKLRNDIDVMRKEIVALGHILCPNV